MRGSVKLRRQGDGLLLDLTWIQADLVRRVMLGYLDHPRGDLAARVLAGAPAPAALAIAGRIAVNEEQQPVTLTLSTEELHVVHATLAAAYVSATSEEDFYLKNGFFLENVQALVLGLARALAAPADRG